jgi:hypothetical protein
MCSLSKLCNPPCWQLGFSMLVVNYDADGTVYSDTFSTFDRTRIDLEHVDAVLRITCTKPYVSVYWCSFSLFI